VSKPGELPDRTPSYKEFNLNRSNRYQTIEAAQKNKPIAPTNVLYWFNTPPGFDEDQLIDVITNFVFSFDLLSLCHVINDWFYFVLVIYQARSETSY
jgi:hypothetical protein